MFKKTFILIVLSISLVSCSKPPANEIGYGVIANGVYENNYFNMKIDAPVDWVILSQAAQDELMRLGGDLLSGEDENFKQILKASEKQSVNLFSFMKFEQGAPVESNPSMMAVAERMTHMPGVKRGSDYHFHVKQLLEKSALTYSFADEDYSVDFGGASFDVMHSTLSVSGKYIEQEYYAAKIKDYVLCFVLSYSTEKEEAELKNILNTMSFSN